MNAFSILPYTFFGFLLTILSIFTIVDGQDGAVVDLSSLKGPAGQDGTDGKDGKNGFCGQNGQNGNNGTNGINGQNGRSVFNQSKNVYTIRENWKQDLIVDVPCEINEVAIGVAGISMTFGLFLSSATLNESGAICTFGSSGPIFGTSSGTCQVACVISVPLIS